MEQTARELRPDASRERDAPIWTAAVHRRVILAVIGLLCLVLLVVLPPYISVSRYQRRVAAAISVALGRPVHFDSISLQLLPVPGLTIQNFVVNEDPAFGAEPILRANTVTARLRFASLWRRRIEVSRISLDAPSVNLVHRPGDGRWNLQGILQQASQLNSAPTAQARPSDAPRFPYIEATDARINFKNGIDKLPFSIREAEFSLWLPQPDQWHLRLSGRPVRTDTDVSDVGLLRVEATLGRAADIEHAPIDLSASWKRTPLGEAAKLTAGYDMGWRGDASGEAALHGTISEAKLTADLHLLGLRRAEFFPERPMGVQAHCEAVSSGILRSLSDLRCAIPTSNETSIFNVMNALRSPPAATSGSDMPDSTAKPGVLLLRGDVPNLLDWHTISGNASLTAASPNYALAWMRIFSRRIPLGISIGGTLDLSASAAIDGQSANQWDGTLTCACILPGLPAGPTATIAANANPAPQQMSPVQEGEQDMHAATPNRWLLTVRHDGADGRVPASVLSITAYSEPSPAKDEPEPAVPRMPAETAVSGQISQEGYTLIYGSRAVAVQMAALLPPLRDELPAEAGGALQSQRTWNGPQSWMDIAPAPRRTATRHRRRR